MYRDLLPIYNECVNVCRALNIPISNNIVRVRTSNRMTRAFGTTKARKTIYDDDFKFEIVINKRILDNRLSIDIARNTIFHELIHTCSGCLNHGKKFMYYGKIIEDNTGLVIEQYVSKSEQYSVEQYYDDRAYKYYIYNSDGKIACKYKNKTRLIKDMIDDPVYYENKGYRLVIA